MTGDLFRDRNIDYSCSMLEALRKMDVIDRKLLMVLKGGHFKGLLSAGDIQRAIINDFELSTEVSVILRDKIRVAKPNDSYDSVKGMMIEHRMEFCPVVDHKGVVKDVYFWEDLFGEINPEPMSSFDLPVVIMAGGFGTRLRPLTYVIPKPMIPINDKTMLEEIFSRFGKYGCNRFFISVNYKSDLIKYFRNCPMKSIISLKKSLWVRPGACHFSKVK